MSMPILDSKAVLNPMYTKMEVRRMCLGLSLANVRRSHAPRAKICST
jgi:hypothetical protein